MRNTKRRQRGGQNPDALMKQWLSKSLSGLILGIPLSFGVLGDLGIIFQVSAQLDQPAALLLRWVPGIIWVSSVCLALTCRSGLQAWGRMLASNSIIWGIYGLLYALCVAGWTTL